QGLADPLAARGLGRDDEEPVARNAEIGGIAGALELALVPDQAIGAGAHAVGGEVRLAAAAGDQRGELAAARLVADRVDVGDVLLDHAERAALGGKSGNARIHRSIEAHALVSIAFLVKPEAGPFVVLSLS